MNTTKPPGIFNDAIGPVMRGPSSSHTAGAHRIASVILQMANNEVSKAKFRFHPTGTLATTYNTQGSDIGLAAGLLGMPITDERMPKALELAELEGIDIEFIIEDYPASHPNTYSCEITTKSGRVFTTTALSVGGGLIEFVEFQGFEIDVQMDLPTFLLERNTDEIDLLMSEISSNQILQNSLFFKQVISATENSLLVLIFKSVSERLAIYLDRLQGYLINPVYPVMGYIGGTLPFQTANDLEKFDDLDKTELWQCAMDYESVRSGIDEDTVYDKMKDIIKVFKNSINTGLKGTNYSDRILGSQSPGFLDALNSSKLLPAGPLNKMMAFTMAIMESKSAMEVIIAAPTAGSAGGLPGAILGMSEELDSSEDEVIKAFLAAGLIGVFISKQATFAAEVAGCQAETGVGAAMAAAGLIQLSGGNAKQALGAASLALQNILGLVCDPVGNRVEIPCLGRNVQSASNALSCANLILGGVDPVIPLSESITTMLEVGKALPRELRCTALGGLAITPTAKKIELKLKQNNDNN